MCGIAGVLYTDPYQTPHRAVLRSMADAVAHRGPDAAGYWVGSGIGLAHRRLSIIDLDGGEQPMANEDGSIQVVFNGEIYNHSALRRELTARGHRFRSKSDTEVLVHLYEEHGAGLVTRLRGMFAFALWDEQRKRLLLARDRIGLKPLFYYLDRDKVLFGSELKTILAHPEVDRTLDSEAIDAYLAFGFIPGDRSIFQRVKKLPPAHVLEIKQAEEATAAASRYWRLEPTPDDSLSLDEWTEAIHDKFSETVQAHRIADVPVGAFLSGGVDSGAIVAEMAGASGEPLKTFSIGFEEQEFSELPFARSVARRYGTDHVEATVSANAAAGLDKLVTFFDEPFADASAIPTLEVARVAREHVKVVVSGDGGDEAFGGYSRYAHDLRENAVRKRLPPWARKYLVAAIARAYPTAPSLPRPLRLKTALTNLSLSPAEAYANTLALFRGAERDRLRSVNGSHGWRSESWAMKSFDRGHDFLQSMILCDIDLLLPDDFLTKVDRASMSVGLEVRPPLVDHELLELAVRIPSKWKVRHGVTKWIFKKLQADRLPADVVWRKKQGFDIPIDAWLRGPLREQAEAYLLTSGKLDSHVSRRAVARLYNAHLRRRGNFGRQLWALLVLAKWLEQYATPVSSRKRTLSVAL